MPLSPHVVEVPENPALQIAFERIDAEILKGKEPVIVRLDRSIQLTDPEVKLILQSYLDQGWADSQHYLPQVRRGQVVPNFLHCF